MANILPSFSQLVEVIKVPVLDESSPSPLDSAVISVLAVNSKLLEDNVSVLDFTVEDITPVTSVCVSGLISYVIVVEATGTSELMELETSDVVMFLKDELM